MDKPQILKGFRDYFDHELILRNKIIDCLKDNALKYQFKQMDTPALEYASNLLAGGQELKKQLYKFTDNGNRSVCLRYDLTMSLARFMLEHKNKISLPFKRCQIGKVWRAEKPQKGRFREFYQADVDILGIDSLRSDIEIIIVLSDSLISFLKNNYSSISITFGIGSRNILSNLIKCFFFIDFIEHNLKQDQAINEILVIIDKMKKLGSNKIAQLLKSTLQKTQNLTIFSSDQTNLQLKAKKNIDQRVDEFLKIISSDDCIHVSNFFEKFYSDQDEKFINVNQEINRLRDLLGFLTNYYKNCKCVNFKLDLSLARGLDYYTGIIFETFIDDNHSYGSICSGGRYIYDLAVKSKNDNKLHGVGGSIGIDRFVAFLHDFSQKNHQESNQINQQKSLLKNHNHLYLISDFTKITVDFLLNFYLICNLMRTKGLIVDYSIKPMKLSKQYQKAAKSQAKFAVFIKDKCFFDQKLSLDDCLLDVKDLTSKQILNYEQTNKNYAEDKRHFNIKLKDLMDIIANKQF